MRDKLTLINRAAALVVLYSFCSTIFLIFWTEETTHQFSYNPDDSRHSLQLHRQDSNMHSASAETKLTLNQQKKITGLYDRVNPMNLHRFPKWGTQQFSKKCSWIVNYRQPKQTDCIFFNRPRAGNNEGMAMWISDTVTAFFGARLANCALLFDYAGLMLISWRY